MKKDKKVCTTTMLSLPGRRSKKSHDSLNQNSTIRFARFFNRMGYCANAKAKKKEKKRQPHLTSPSIHQSLNDLSNFCPPSKSLLFRLFSSAVSSPSLPSLPSFEAECAVPLEPRLEDRWLVKPPVKRRDREAVRER
jgi:hypothetical protein